MGRLFRFSFLMAGIFLLSGCLIRTYTIRKPRTDIDIQGNRGYLVGSPPAGSPTEIKNKTRTVTVVEVELGGIKDESELSPAKEHPKEKEVFQEESSGEEISGEESARGKLENTAAEENAAKKEKVEYQEYTIKKGDTLQKISYKFYGTHKKWPKIFDANRDVLSDPNEIQPGKVIRIPLE